MRGPSWTRRTEPSGRLEAALPAAMGHVPGDLVAQFRCRQVGAILLPGSDWVDSCLDSLERVGASQLFSARVVASPAPEEGAG